ncbi:Ig-like domain-containing protein [Lysobacter terrae]
MNHRYLRVRTLAALIAAACACVHANDFGHPDHYEFGASFDVAFKPQGGRWPAVLHFDYPGAGDSTSAAWTLDVIAPNGEVVATEQGLAPLKSGRGKVTAWWNGKQKDGRVAAEGYYTLRMRAVPTVTTAQDLSQSDAKRIADAFAAFEDEVVEQTYDVMVGAVAPAKMPNTKALGVGAKGHAAAAAKAETASAPTRDAMVTAQSIPEQSGLPYTIYYGNFHSQTNHSDGGTEVASCGGAEVPQGGTQGPTEAYTMMQNQAGGDFLLTSEHNHMYDGSTGTNTSASPATANNLFNSGLQLASNYRSAHSNFMALYGNEWGVISNGGHLNILNPDVLATWEKNASGQLLGGVETPKSNYPALYATMKARGWIGQFNHPATSGQFLVGTTPLGYDANGADVMMLAEVLNSSAFSTNTTETETGRSSYEGAFKILLERGYKVAPTSDQDNHCANWGLSFTNRTGVLLPTGTTLTTANFLDAVRARRAFATEDKTGQLVLTANGHVMGESFASSGALTLTANYASTGGQTTQRVQFFEGVPGRNGTVTQLTEGSGTYTFTPAAGEHFYYALVTQANGKRLWSAPVWVSQGSGPSDTTPPTVSASETGSSGTITFSASASDNVGVSKVEFYVDGLLQGSDTAAPYSMTLDSTTLANGSHNLTAKAFDAAGNSTVSTAVPFTVSNSTADTTPPTVSASESGTSGTITLSATASDNVGVSSVDFFVDGALKGTDSAAPYSMTLNSTTLANGSHGLVAVAYDAAGNSGTSSTVNFSVNNVAQPVQLILNGGFESGSSSWTASSGVITSSTTYAAHGGSYKAWLNGYGTTSTDYVRQDIAIPSTATTVTLRFWLRVDSDETTTTTAYDTLAVQVRNTGNTVLTTLGSFSNLNKGSVYVEKTFDVSAYKGQTVRIYFEGKEGTQVATSFLVDDVSVTAQ